VNVSWLGRFQQGVEVPISVTTTLADGTPAWPLSPPSLEVWKDVSPLVLVQTLLLPSFLPGGTVGKFRYGLFLGPLYSNVCRYHVFIRWQDTNSVPLQVVSSFELLAGGSPRGSIIAMTDVTRPDARYLLTSTDAGTLYRRTNPR
jgi:hypothetical protein